MNCKSTVEWERSVRRFLQQSIQRIMSYTGYWQWKWTDMNELRYILQVELIVLANEFDKENKRKEGLKDESQYKCVGLYEHEPIIQIESK